MITFKSKHLRAKASRSIALALVALTLVCTACSSEQLITPGNENGEALVTLSLTLPGNASPQTRALDDTQEDAVDNLWVLAFAPNGGNYAYMAKCTKVLLTYQATLRTGTWDLVLMANADAILTTHASLLRTTNNKATVLAGLTLEHTTKWNATHGSVGYVSIPMCSDPQDTNLVNQAIAEGTQIKNGAAGIDLYRMLARINVNLGSKNSVDAKDNFTITEVHYYNRNTKGYLAPDRSAVGADKAKLHDLATGNYGASNTLPYTGTEIVTGSNGETSCINEIYAFEVNNTTSGIALTTRPCLVVGGTYKGTTNYYRVDFSTGTGVSQSYLDILRNHSYNFTINAVNGPGYATAIEAFESFPVNIEVAVMPWDDGKIGEVVFDGQYGLGVNRKEFTLFKDPMTDQTPGGINELLALTTYTGNWTVTVMNDDKTTPATAANDAKWLTVIAASGGSAAYHLNATGNAQQGFYLQTTENNDGAPRTAYIHVRVKNLIQEIKVTQTDKAAISLKLTNDSGDEVTELLWLNGDVASQDLIATWLPITKKCGITKANSTKGAFPFALPVGGFGANTNNGGTQTYNITPAAIATTDADYPFIDRSTIKTFSITADGTTLTKTVTLRQKNYALVPADFKALVLPGVTQTATVHCNTNWTVAVTTGASLLDAGTTTLGVAAATTGTLNNFTYKFKANTYGKVTFTFSPAITTEPFADTTPIEVTVESVQALPYPAYPGVIGYDPATQTLNLNGVGYMVYFKYGGIIGMYARGNNDTWSADDIAFNPTSIPFSANFDLCFPTGAGEVGTYSTVGNVNITGTFLSVANGRNGNGDPCRFMNLDGAGMTASEVKAALGSGTVPDKSQWRLPTNSGVDISIAFAPAQSNWVQGIAPSGESNAGHTFSGLAKGSNYVDAAWNFLPAAGLRNAGNGTVFTQGSYGYFWSSTPINATTGYYLRFSNNAVSPSSNYSQSSGLAVRCVRQ